jgi:phosphoglycolate phosphatase
MPTHLYFDFDGTLVNSLEAAFNAFQRVGPTFGCAPLSRDQLERLRGLHAREVVRALGVPLHRLPQLAARMRRTMRGELMETPPVEGIAEVLDVLQRRGLALGILSSNARESVTAYVRRHRLPGLADIVGETGVFGKAAALRRQVRRLGLESRDLVYVGDELRDLEAARAARARFAAVAWGYTPMEHLAAAAPDFRCERPQDLLFVASRSPSARDVCAARP